MRTVWLASYPKSGNTWFRMLLANLSAEDGKPADINDMPERGSIASAREPFDYITLLDSTLLSHDEIENLRPRVHEVLAGGAEDDEYDTPPDTPPVRFIKTHDPYICTGKREPLLAGTRGADAAIVIVRDPRDVAPSVASHSRMTIDNAIEAMNNTGAALCGETDRLRSQLRQRLLTWGGHIASWLDQTDLPVHLIRYEDLHADTARVFARALAFAGRPASGEQIARAVELTSFAQLQAQERERGFREAVRPFGSRFFRRGEAGAWRDELTPEQAARIEADHAPMMRRLGYDVREARAAASQLGEVA